jgi:hypothetical protein
MKVRGTEFAWRPRSSKTLVGEARLSSVGRRHGHARQSLPVSQAYPGRGMRVFSQRPRLCRRLHSHAATCIRWDRRRTKVTPQRESAVIGAIYIREYCLFDPPAVRILTRRSQSCHFLTSVARPEERPGCVRLLRGTTRSRPESAGTARGIETAGVDVDSGCCIVGVRVHITGTGIAAALWLRADPVRATHQVKGRGSDSLKTLHFSERQSLSDRADGSNSV